jgi:hypothetical protein
MFQRVEVRNEADCMPLKEGSRLARLSGPVSALRLLLNLDIFEWIEIKADIQIQRQSLSLLHQIRVLCSGSSTYHYDINQLPFCQTKWGQMKNKEGRPESKRTAAGQEYPAPTAVLFV